MLPTENLENREEQTLRNLKVSNLGKVERCGIEYVTERDIMRVRRLEAAQSML
jgi:hypothetical protein